MTLDPHTHSLKVSRNGVILERRIWIIKAEPKDSETLQEINHFQIVELKKPLLNRLYVNMR